MWPQRNFGECCAVPDFDAWHFVQNEYYLTDSESEWDEFYANDGDLRKDEIIASWDKIFDTDHQ